MAVLSAVLEACDDRRSCRWDVKLAPVDAAKSMSTARESAMSDARRQASELARTAGVRVGPLVSIREVEAKPPGLDRLTPQHFSEDGLHAYEALLAARLAAIPKATQLLTLEVRFEIKR